MYTGKKTIILIIISIIVFSFLIYTGPVEAQKRLNVEVQPAALKVCQKTKVIITITDGDNNRVENATIFINSEKVDGGNGIVTKWIHATEAEVAAGIKVRVEKEGFTPIEGTIKVFRPEDQGQEYDALIEAGKLILEAVSLAKTGGGKLKVDSSNTRIDSWSGHIRLPTGEVVTESATSIEGEIYVNAIGPDMVYIFTNFTELKVVFAPSIWGGQPTGISTAILDTTYRSGGLMNTTSGEIWMSFQTKLTNDILKTPAIELGWWAGIFDNETGLLTLHGHSAIISWPPHDIAVTDVTPSKTVVRQGSSVNIDVTVANEGDYPETFDITVYADTTEIETQETTLSSGASTTLTFTWNTTGFAAEGQYTISAYAWPVPGETDTADNTLVNGCVSVFGCFIATAAYGTPMAPQIDVLREFRDEYLLTNPVGQALVGFYYQVSPPIAEFITEHPALKPVVRAGLAPAVAMSTVAVKTTLAQKIAIVGSMALVSALLVVRLRKRAGKAGGRAN